MAIYRCFSSRLQGLVSFSTLGPPPWAWVLLASAPAFAFRQLRGYRDKVFRFDAFLLPIQKID
ncbi:MAG: hypothetical protein ACYDHX_17085 [Methanothrix sp.]